MEKYTCTDLQVNSNMGGVECHYSSGVFFLDKKNIVKIGDEVVFERDEKGFYSKIWINGIDKS